MTLSVNLPWLQQAGPERWQHGPGGLVYPLAKHKTALQTGSGLNSLHSAVEKKTKGKPLLRFQYP